MKNISAVIVEDSYQNREALKKLLELECPFVHISGAAETVEEAFEMIGAEEPDLVFLDVQLKSKTGFDLLDRLMKSGGIDFEIIFITAHGKYEYATRAISYSALEFLNKPVDPKKLAAAVEKARSKLRREQYQNQIRILLENIASPKSKVQRIAIHRPRGVVEFVPIEDIVYLEADRSVTRIHMEDDKVHNALRNLGHYGKLLEKDHPFFRIRDNILVNLNYVRRYDHGNLTLTLLDGSKLNAARRKGQKFREFLNSQGGANDRLDKSWWKRILGS